MNNNNNYARLMLFLKHNKILDKYKNYFKKRRSAELREYLKDISAEVYIAGIFTWANTKEGQRFWSGINNKWYYFLNNNIIKIKFKIK